jgi:hypothetical protein
MPKNRLTREKMAAMNGLSKRGAANVDTILPRISAAVAERSDSTVVRIDMSTAENWLLRDEIIELTKEGILSSLSPHVSPSIFIQSR